MHSIFILLAGIALCLLGVGVVFVLLCTIGESDRYDYTKLNSKQATEIPFKRCGRCGFATSFPDAFSLHRCIAPEK